MGANVLPGRSFPLGATVVEGGVNFSIYSASATRLELLLFATPDAPEPERVIALDPQVHRSAYYWHVLVPGIAAGQVYAYRVYGPFDPQQGLRYDGQKVLLDPYARAVVNGENYSRQAATHAGDNCARALRAVVVDPDTYDWEGDVPLQTSTAKTVIYELHVGGFTRHANSEVAPERRGTFAGLIDKIPYLKELGITAVELLPVHAFDEQDAPPGLSNYWGYSTLGFFAPHWRYSSRRDPLGPVDEFRDMVKALHRAGIEVILDVVFNHSAEGSHAGPTLNFKGLENAAYYLLEPNRAHYSNFSGCGNTLNTNHPIVSRLIIDSLRYWVDEMHVDGFRFDLASVLMRGPYGHPIEQPPVLWAIETDPALAEAKVIAEAWDAAGLYHVGAFVGGSRRFGEWNGPFRDDVRRFLRGDDGTVGRLAQRLQGSPDIYSGPGFSTYRSINFVTCHDGFTLNDLVSYDRKHNLANNEDNRDGSNANHSWNCGVEGPTDDPEVEALRRRQIKNLLTVLFVSQGTPMLWMGDEVRRTQRGNNNAYCQDNELSWFDWSCVDTHSGLLRFVRGLIALTQSLALFEQDMVPNGVCGLDTPCVTWHGIRPGEPDWHHHSHSLAFSLWHPRAKEQVHILLNAWREPLTFELPPVIAGQTWHRVIDTALDEGEDYCDPATAPPTGPSYTTAPHSAVVLIAGPR